MITIHLKVEYKNSIIKVLEGKKVFLNLFYTLCSKRLDHKSVREEKIYFDLFDALLRVES